MDASLLYNALHAEILATQGQWLGAAQLMHDTAKHERTRPELYERATQMALLAAQPELGLQVVQDWRRNFPQSAAAARYALQLHLLLRQRDAAVAAMRDFLRYTKAENLDSAMTVLPGYFALPSPTEANAEAEAGKRARIDLSTAQALEAVLLPYTQNAAHAATAWGVVANIRAQSGQGSAALQAATQALTLDRSNANAAWVLLQALQAKDEQGRPLQAAPERQAASEALAAYVEQNTIPPNLRLRYAAFLIEEQKNQAALVQIRILTKAQPSSSRFWLMQGLIEMEIAPQDGAADDSLRQAWQLIAQGDDDERGALRDEVLLSLSRLAQLRGDLPAALQWLGQTSPNASARIQKQHALLLAQSGQWQKALSIIDKLPEGADFSARQKLWAQLEILGQAEQYNAAYEHLAAFVHSHPKDDEARYDLAMLAEKKGDLATMEKLLREVIAQQPKNPLAYNALGYALAERNLRLPEAKELITQALQLAPNNAMIQDSMGWVEYRLGNLSAAREHLQAAFAQLPDGEIGAHLGEVLWQMGEADAARAVWRKALGADPDNSALQNTLKRLELQP